MTEDIIIPNRVTAEQHSILPTRKRGRHDLEASNIHNKKDVRSGRLVMYSCEYKGFFLHSYFSQQSHPNHSPSTKKAKTRWLPQPPSPTHPPTTTSASAPTPQSRTSPPAPPASRPYSSSTAFPHPQTSSAN